MTHAIETITIKDAEGAEHKFRLTGSDFRRVGRRLRALGDFSGVDSMYTTLWESRVDKSEQDEDSYFARFNHHQLTSGFNQLMNEHGEEKDPMKATPQAPPTAE